MDLVFQMIKDFVFQTILKVFNNKDMDPQAIMLILLFLVIYECVHRITKSSNNKPNNQNGKPHNQYTIINFNINTK